MDSSTVSIFKKDGQIIMQIAIVLIAILHRQIIQKSWFWIIFFLAVQRHHGKDISVPQNADNFSYVNS